MLKLKEVTSYYEDGTIISEVITKESHKTTIEKDGQRFTIEVTDSGIKLDIDSVEKRIEKAETVINAKGLVRKWGEIETKATFSDETIKEIIKGINRIQRAEGRILLDI